MCYRRARPDWNLDSSDGSADQPNTGTAPHNHMRLIASESVTSRTGSPALDALRKVSAEARQNELARIVGESPGIREAKRAIRMHAHFGTSVLILGATGTGKGLVAHVLHSMSQRRGEFVHINCATIQPELADSYLFGHEPGSFTGAGPRRRIGAVERANGGTLFLDEITELPLHVQAKLLTVLDDGQYEPVGGSRSKYSEFRLVVATSADLGALVEQGQFREDLYYRIQNRVIRLPDLADRGFDVVLLARALLDRISRDIGREVTITREAEALLLRHHWRGNVRQLCSVLMEAVVQADGSLISQVTMDDVLGSNRDPKSGARKWIPTLEEVDQGAKREAIERALAATGGNKAEAARLLGISTSSLYRYRRKLGME